MTKSYGNRPRNKIVRKMVALGDYSCLSQESIFPKYLNRSKPFLYKYLIRKFYKEMFQVLVNKIKNLRFTDKSCKDPKRFLSF